VHRREGHPFISTYCISRQLAYITVIRRQTRQINESRKCRKRKIRKKDAEEYALLQSELDILGSSVKSVGEFWLRKFAKYVI